MLGVYFRAGFPDRGLLYCFLLYRVLEPSFGLRDGERGAAVFAAVAHERHYADECHAAGRVGLGFRV